MAPGAGDTFVEALREKQDSSAGMDIAARARFLGVLLMASSAVDDTESACRFLNDLSMLSSGKHNCSE